MTAFAEREFFFAMPVRLSCHAPHALVDPLHYVFTDAFRSECFSSGTVQFEVFFGMILMAEGTIKRLTDKGFGFIDAGTGQDLFFHMSNVTGTDFDELREGQRVTFTEGQGPKGPRAENVTVIEA